MRRILIGLLIVILGLTSLNLYKRITEDSDFKVKFHVYSQRSAKSIEILLRKIPIRYDTIIKIDIIEPYSKELNLYKVNIDIYGGMPDVHYIVYDKDNREIGDLKSEYLFANIKDPDHIDFDTIDSYCIDLKIFKQVFQSRLTSGEAIANKYAELLASSTDSTDFKRIKGSADIESIKRTHHQTKAPMIAEDETIKDFGFLNDTGPNEYLYWFYDKGLMKIQLDFNNTQLNNVRTLRLGNLGVEIKHF